MGSAWGRPASGKLAPKPRLQWLPTHSVCGMGTGVGLLGPCGLLFPRQTLSWPVSSCGWRYFLTQPGPGLATTQLADLSDWSQLPPTSRLCSRAVGCPHPHVMGACEAEACWGAVWKAPGPVWRAWCLKCHICLLPGGCCSTEMIPWSKHPASPLLCSHPCPAPSWASMEPQVNLKGLRDTSLLLLHPATVPQSPQGTESPVILPSVVQP